MRAFEPARAVAEQQQPRADGEDEQRADGPEDHGQTTVDAAARRAAAGADGVPLSPRADVPAVARRASVPARREDRFPPPAPLGGRPPLPLSRPRAMPSA
jgi:hypothetical protein